MHYALTVLTIFTEVSIHTTCLETSFNVRSRPSSYAWATLQVLHCLLLSQFIGWSFRMGSRPTLWVNLPALFLLLLTLEYTHYLVWNCSASRGAALLLQLLGRKLPSDRKKKFSPVRVVVWWNRLPKQLIDFPSLEPKWTKLGTSWCCLDLGLPWMGVWISRCTEVRSSHGFSLAPWF